MQSDVIKMAAPGLHAGKKRIGLCNAISSRTHPVRYTLSSLVHPEAMASADLRDDLLCSICENIYTDPVTLRCGHNFCRDCIDKVLNTQDGAGVYSCPECKAEFQERPTLIKNITLCNEAERFLSTQPHQEEITGICCSYCIHSPVPAVRSCLLCEASLCDNHLRYHSKSPEHVLTDPSTSLEKRKCSVHKKVLEYYCTEDNACICVFCGLAGEHEGHQVARLDEASEKKKTKMRNVLRKLTTKRVQTEERLQSFEDHWRIAQENADGEVERVTALFIDIRRRLDDLEKRVLSEISRQEEQLSLSMHDLFEKLEIKKEELCRKMRHIEELCNMADPLTVLQDPDTENKRKRHHVEESSASQPQASAVSGTECGGDGVIVRTGGAGEKVLAAEEGEIYGQGPVDIVLDINTAANDIHVLDDLKTATRIQWKQSLPETAERFQSFQVMSKQGFTSGRHYWDVEISREEEVWKVGMCYPSIDRSGRQSYIGNNKKSWSLCKGHGDQFNKPYAVRHNRKIYYLPHQILSNRVRICLDYEAGRLSFYELGDSIRHLHTFSATFTEPLHAVLGVWEGQQ
ncbi:E3 ubiquitin/ISG15 ligase TRIM25-like [Dendropsophus ebraccatus]|uniref:E3 ubiquitin/ISG15 ligase TRIM25-like n=1 Tax=Dendropsophus ebraccatus TaxID=150705 RepID=UPI003831A3F6